MGRILGSSPVLPHHNVHPTASRLLPKRGSWDVTVFILVVVHPVPSISGFLECHNMLLSAKC